MQDTRSSGNKNEKGLDIFLFSNGQNFSPPRKYHLKEEELQTWDSTLSNLAHLQYSSTTNSILLHTLNGQAITNPEELVDGAAYVALPTSMSFLQSGYDQYMTKASKSREKRQAKIISAEEETTDPCKDVQTDDASINIPAANIVAVNRLETGDKANNERINKFSHQFQKATGQKLAGLKPAANQAKYNFPGVGRKLGTGPVELSANKAVINRREPYTRNGVRLPRPTFTGRSLSSDRHSSGVKPLPSSKKVNNQIANLPKSSYKKTEDTKTNLKPIQKNLKGKLVINDKDSKDKTSTSQKHSNTTSRPTDTKAFHVQELAMNSKKGLIGKIDVTNSNKKETPIPSHYYIDTLKSNPVLDEIKTLSISVTKDIDTKNTTDKFTRSSHIVTELSNNITPSYLNLKNNLQTIDHFQITNGIESQSNKTKSDNNIISEEPSHVMMTNQSTGYKQKFDDNLRSNDNSTRPDSMNEDKMISLLPFHHKKAETDMSDNDTKQKPSIPNIINNHRVSTSSRIFNGEVNIDNTNNSPDLTNALQKMPNAVDTVTKLTAINNGNLILKKETAIDQSNQNTFESNDKSKIIHENKHDENFVKSPVPDQRKFNKHGSSIQMEKTETEFYTTHTMNRTDTLLTSNYQLYNEVTVNETKAPVWTEETWSDYKTERDMILKSYLSNIFTSATDNASYVQRDVEPEKDSNERNPLAASKPFKILNQNKADNEMPLRVSQAEIHRTINTNDPKETLLSTPNLPYVRNPQNLVISNEDKLLNNLSRENYNAYQSFNFEKYIGLNQTNPDLEKDKTISQLQKEDTIANQVDVDPSFTNHHNINSVINSSAESATVLDSIYKAPTDNLKSGIMQITHSLTKLENLDFVFGLDVPTHKILYSDVTPTYTSNPINTLNPRPEKDNEKLHYVKTSYGFNSEESSSIRRVTKTANDITPVVDFPLGIAKDNSPKGQKVISFVHRAENVDLQINIELKSTGNATNSKHAPDSKELPSIDKKKIEKDDNDTLTRESSLQSTGNAILSHICCQSSKRNIIYSCPCCAQNFLGDVMQNVLYPINGDSQQYFVLLPVITPTSVRDGQTKPETSEKKVQYSELLPKVACCSHREVLGESKIIRKTLESKRVSIAASDEKEIQSEELAVHAELTQTSSILIAKKSTQDAATQTDWCYFLLEARLHEDGHYTFHLPPLELLREFKL